MREATSLPCVSGDRDTCWQCYRIRSLCLCSGISTFQIEPIIALLVHPKEYQRTVGTARVVKLSIQNCRTWTGYGSDFDSNPEFLALINNPNMHCVILYPGTDSLNLSDANADEIALKLPVEKQLVIFVIDGTWANAKRMIRLSQVLRQLPKLSFNIKKESQYGFRKQPKAFCLSTVEAVCELIDNLQEQKLCRVTPPQGHLNMLKVFKNLVEGQLRAQVELRRPRFVP